VASGPVGAVARAAGRAPAAELQVPPDRADHAVEALRRVPDLTAAAIGGRPGVLMLSVDPGGDANPALAAVLDAGVPVLSYTMQGTRLSDAFLTVTGGGQ
jgi:ABC-2 type transport system ATP-binding protein